MVLHWSEPLIYVNVGFYWHGLVVRTVVSQVPGSIHIYLSFFFLFAFCNYLSFFLSCFLSITLCLSLLSLFLSFLVLPFFCLSTFFVFLSVFVVHSAFLRFSVLLCLYFCLSFFLVLVSFFPFSSFSSNVVLSVVLLGDCKLV